MIQAVIFDLGGTLLHYFDSKTVDKQRHFRRVFPYPIRANPCVRPAIPPARNDT